MLSRPDLIERLYPGQQPTTAHAGHQRALPAGQPPWRPSAAADIVDAFTPRTAAVIEASKQDAYTPRTAAAIQASQREAAYIAQLGFVFPALPGELALEALRLERRCGRVRTHRRRRPELRCEERALSLYSPARRLWTSRKVRDCLDDDVSTRPPTGTGPHRDRETLAGGEAVFVFHAIYN